MIGTKIKLRNVYSRLLGKQLAKRQDERMSNLVAAFNTVGIITVEELKPSWFGREQAYIRNLRDIV